MDDMLFGPQGIPEAVELVQSQGPSETVLILAVVLGVGALRLAEAVIKRYMPAGKSKQGDWSDEDREMLEELHKMHSRFGPDGNPVWYNQIDNAAVVQMARDLAKVAEIQRDVLRILERMDARKTG